jgi:adhesin transport system outer membrane protein
LRLQIFLSAVIFGLCCQQADAQASLVASTSAREADPVLGLRDQHIDPDRFRAAIQATVKRHPGTAEAAAVEEEARQGVAGARQLQFPRLDISTSSYRVIARDFSNDPFNIIERSQPLHRTDVQISAQQTLFDFGATAKQIRAASDRLRGANADAEAANDRTAVSAIAAWYDVFGYRALVSLSRSFVADQQEVRLGVQQRIRQGVSAESDLAGVDSAIARGNTRLAGYQRGLANAEARFAALTGGPAPAVLGRAPTPAGLPADHDTAAMLGSRVATVRSADASADAIAHDAAVARAQAKPQLTGGIDAARYGLLETEGDYEIRGSLNLRQRLFGGVAANVRQAGARARAARAHADVVREEASRDAAIAWSDVQALETQLDALESAHVAARRSRDATFERFRASRGTMFDVLSAQEAYFGTATAYIQGLIDLDAARYTLLSRSGELLARLGISSPSAQAGS